MGQRWPVLSIQDLDHDIRALNISKSHNFFVFMSKVVGFRQCQVLIHSSKEKTHINN